LEAERPIPKKNVKPETWNPRHALGVGVAWVGLLSAVLASATACLPTLPAPATATPTVIATSTSTHTPMPSPTVTPTVTPTAMPTATPTPSPTPTPVPSSDVALIRGPYVQSVTSDSIVVVWETDLPSTGEVAYGETAAYGAGAADPTVTTRHAITLTGLAPYTVYHYRVESGGAPLSEDLTFRTAAGPDQTRFTFVAFGDTRTGHKVHQAVVARIVAQTPDFVLHTGDLVAMGTATHLWETFFEIERELMARIPLFPALGNHEGNNPRYFDLFYLPGNERWYAFDYGNARFICLQVDGFAEFGPKGEQYAWLEETLAANTQPWLFVTFHVPPYSSARDDLENDVRQTLVPLFERYGVDVVFSGHEHNYERNEVSGITYVVTAGGGAPLYALQEPGPTQAAFARAYHLVLVRIDGGRLQATVISSEGEVLDEFERSAE